MTAVTVNNIRYYPSDTGYIAGSDSNINGNEPTAAISKTALSGTLVIPAQVNGLPMLGFAQFAFARCYLITKLVIQAKIDVIGYRAFSDCYNLVDIEIPASVQTIEKCGIHFWNFTAYAINLNSISNSYCAITFKKGSKLTSMKDEVFGYIKNLKLIFESDVKSSIQTVNGTTFICVSSVSVIGNLVQIGQFLFTGKYKVVELRTVCGETFYTNFLSIGIFIFFVASDS